MQQPDLKGLVSPERFDEIRDYILRAAPLVPEGRKITVGAEALESLLPRAFSDTLPFMESLRAIFSWGKNKKSTNLTPQLKSVLTEAFNAVAEKLPFDAKELEQTGGEKKRTVLMADPERLTEKGYGTENRVQVFKKWLCVRHALLQSGARLEVMKSQADHIPQVVYTRDQYVAIGDTVYLPDPKALEDAVFSPSSSFDMMTFNPVRYVNNHKLHIAQFEKDMRARGMKTVYTRGAWFEGGNVVRHFSSRTLFFGLGGDAGAAESAQKIVATINETQGEKWSLVIVPLTDRDMYHLDTGMSEELPNGEVMISRRVTNKEAYDVICRAIGEDKIIELADDEAGNLASNMIDVGDMLIMTGNCPSLKEKLEARGYRVIGPADYGQKSFEFGLGGVHCMTNDLPPVHKKQSGACIP